MKLLKPLIFIISLAVIFYFPFFRHHFVPVPLDIVPGMYLPWLDKTIPVKNPLPSDVVSLTLPLRYSAINLMKSGHWPLWNPQIISGTPLLANFQSAPFNFLNLLYLLPYKFIDIWSLQIIFQPILAFLFFYLFISLFIKNPIARLLGSTIWAFNGFFALWFQYNTVVYAAIFLPLILFAIVKISQNFFWGFIISISLCASVFSGNPPVTMIVFAAVSLFTLIFYWSKPKKIFLIYLFIFLSLIYASPQLIPGIESSKNSIRNSDQVALNSNIKYLPAIRMLTIFTPDFFGNPTTRNTWIDHNLYDNLTIYNGLLAIVLFLISFKIKFSPDHKKILKYVYLLSAITFIFMLPNFLSKFIGSFSFLGLNSMVFSRLSLLWSFSLATISALTLSVLINTSIKFKKVLLPIIIVPMVPLILLIISFTLNKYFSRILYIDYDWLVQTKVAYRNCLYPLLFSTIISATLALYFLITNKTIRSLCLIFLLLINIFDLHKFFTKYNSFSPVKYFYPQSEVLDYLQKNSFRFARESAEIIPSNMWMMYPNLKTATGYDTTYSQNYGHFMSLINSNSLNNSSNRFLEIDNFNSHLLNLLSIDHIIATKKDKFGLSEKGKLAFSIESAKFKLVTDFGDYQLLKNSSSLPFIRPAKTIVFQKNIDEIQKLLLSKNYSDLAIIDQKISSSDSLDSKVKITDQIIDSQSISFKTQSLKPSFIIISQNYDPGWNLNIDSQASKLIKTNFTFSGIFIPSGSHQVYLHYEPRSFYLSIRIALASIILSLITIIIALIWKKFRH